MLMRFFVPDYGLTAALLQGTAPVVLSGPSIGPLPLLLQSVMGWIGFITALASISLVGWRAGKEKARQDAHEEATKVRLDGFGQRLEEVEVEQDRLAAERAEWIRSLERVLSSNENLVAAVGRANKAAEDCESHSEGYFIQIGSKLDLLTKELSDTRRVDGERLKALETRLDFPRH